MRKGGASSCGEEKNQITEKSRIGRKSDERGNGIKEKKRRFSPNMNKYKFL